MSTKHFIKVGKTCQHKNKIQKSVLETLEKFDQTLWPSIEESAQAIRTEFKKTLDDYTGSAKKPDLQSFIPKDNALTIFVEDLIYLNLYGVKKYKP